MNWEAYFFSTPERKARFDHTPWKNAGLVTDPVTMRRFEPGASSPRVDHNGRAYYFEGAESRSTFAAFPDSFALPLFSMLPKAEAESE